LSQSDVARALGLNQSAVCRWESGKARPRGRHAVALLELLGVAWVSRSGSCGWTRRRICWVSAASTYYAAARRGEVPGIRVGRRLVVPGAALARLLGGDVSGTDIERGDESAGPA